MGIYWHSCGMGIAYGVVDPLEDTRVWSLELGAYLALRGVVVAMGMVRVMFVNRTHMNIDPIRVLE